MGNDDDPAYGSDTDMDEQTQYGGGPEDEDATEQTERRTEEDENGSSNTDEKGPDAGEEAEEIGEDGEEGFGQDETDPE